MLKRLILPCALLFLSAPVWADKFEATLADFKAANGTEEFFSEAYGYAIFPTVGKGGIGIGGAYGKGRVFAGGSYTGDTSVAQLTIGFQLGGQAYSQIIFFQDKHSFDRFTSGSFEFGAEVSAVALTMGAQAKAGSTGVSAGGNESSSGDASLTGGWSAGMAVFTLAKGGLMYEASIGGQKFSYRPLPVKG
jgi:lipid-binding SYLF domain-containing protein